EFKQTIKEERERGEPCYLKKRTRKEKDELVFVKTYHQKNIRIVIFEVGKRYIEEIEKDRYNQERNKERKKILIGKSWRIMKDTSKMEKGIKPKWRYYLIECYQEISEDREEERPKYYINLEEELTFLETMIDHTGRVRQVVLGTNQEYEAHLGKGK